ncbi:hypothetical protein VTN96DRAFT_733 [Rasamsonia emersonii]
MAGPLKLLANSILGGRSVLGSTTGHGKKVAAMMSYAKFGATTSMDFAGFALQQPVSQTKSNSARASICQRIHNPCLAASGSRRNMNQILIPLGLGQTST